MERARSTNGFELLAVAQLVVPFDQFPDHAGLVVHFLRPVDIAVARAEQTRFRDGRAPGREKNGDVFAGRIHGGTDHVGRPDADVHHHGGNFPRNHRVTMRHGDGKVLVSSEDGLRHAHALLFGLGVGLDDRGKVGPGVAEEVFDPAIGEKSEIGGGNAVRFSGWHPAASPFCLTRFAAHRRVGPARPRRRWRRFPRLRRRRACRWAIG